MVFCFGLRVSKATTVSLFCLKLFDIFCDFSISVRLVGMVYEGRPMNFKAFNIFEKLLLNLFVYILSFFGKVKVTIISFSINRVFREFIIIIDPLCIYSNNLIVFLRMHRGSVGASLTGRLGVFNM